ncbi:hypothetical protein ROSINTL182_06199 [Roseburia intestinalis L1-82]|uniref:Uncharacterized protein n=1 Tax=Roseburia intestinalis L1-82 TaxID=536231 RepID=C7G8H5_9FIRM|nr:hypothetical protein ROSINTL182_06199 [Roseburia intestinalis L1-82]
MQCLSDFYGQWTCLCVIICINAVLDVAKVPFCVIINEEFS